MIFRPVKNFPDYEISPSGQVRRRLTGRVLKTIKRKRGAGVHLRHNGFRSGELMVTHLLHQAFGTPLPTNRGELNGQVKLTAADVRMIRESYAQLSSYEVAPIFDIAASTVRKIRQRRTWKHID
jgi:hypothetical protein